MSDVQKLDSIGNPQPETTEPVEVQAPAEAEQAPAFHSHKWDDGKEDVWKTKEELDDWMRQSGMRHSDYTRKTQGVAETRKLLDQQRKDYETKERNFNESYSGIMSKDKFLRENPQIASRIAQEMKGTTGDSNVERLIADAVAPLSEKLSGYEKDRDRQAEDVSRNQAYETMAGKYADFDRGTIDAAIQRVNEVPEAMRLEAMVELFYHAEKGRKTPGEIERKLAMSSSKPRPTTPTSSVKIPDNQVTPLNNEQTTEMLVAAMDAAKPG